MHLICYLSVHLLRFSLISHDNQRGIVHRLCHGVVHVSDTGGAGFVASSEFCGPGHEKVIVAGDRDSAVVLGGVVQCCEIL